MVANRSWTTFRDITLAQAKTPAPTDTTKKKKYQLNSEKTFRKQAAANAGAVHE